MKIAVAVKVVHDDQDILIMGDQSLDYSKARADISMYDLNAIEAAVRLKEANEGSSVVAITVGPAYINDSKLKKSILARGVDELYLVADDSLDGYSSRQTAAALAKLLAGVEGGWDLVICGDGSADEYAQQVDVQLGVALDVPVINAVTALEAEAGGASIIATRTLESSIEKVRLPLPAVLSVSPEVALPRIAGMKDILAAGKKPMIEASAIDKGINEPATLEATAPLAPEPTPRAQQIYESVDEFVAAAAAVLR